MREITLKESLVRNERKEEGKSAMGWRCFLSLFFKLLIIPEHLSLFRSEVLQVVPCLLGY